MTFLIGGFRLTNFGDFRLTVFGQFNPTLTAAGQSIYEYDKNGTVAKAYAEFTREVLKCGEKQRNKHESSLSR